MAAKHILMGFCALYALARGIGTVLYYLSGAGQLQIAVLIISFIVSVIGSVMPMIVTLIGACGFRITVRLLLFLYSGAAVANILITRGNPVPQGIGPWEILITGTVFECLLFLASLLIPLPDHPYAGK